jgi:hypothetical protein
MLLLTLETLALGVAVLAFLTIIGLGITEYLLPAEGMHLLLAPAVGLAALMLGFQWLSILAPPPEVAIIMAIVLAPLSAVIGWRRRPALIARWRDLAGAGAIAAVYYVAVLQVVIQRGVLTLGSFPADNIFIYAQAGQYLRDHPMPSALHGVDVASPGSFYLTSVGLSFPNSVGPIDAAASVLTGIPVYAVFDPLNALGLAITIGAVWLFVRDGLGGSWWAAAVASALLATNQLLYWVTGVGLQQESLALPIFTTGAYAVVVAVRKGSLRAGVLAGILAAALVGLYLPVAALLIVCAIACALTCILAQPGHWKRVMDPMVVAAATLLVASLPAAYVLLFRGGLDIWTSVLGTRVAAGAISKFPDPLYLLGTLPFAHVWELSQQPLGHLETVGWPLLILASLLLLALIATGLVRAVVEKHGPEAGILAAGLLFVAYEGLVARYPYGFVKSIGYIVPLTSAFAGYGAVGLAERVPERFRKLVAIAVALVAGLVVLASANATRDMLRLWVGSPPALASADLRIGDIASAVPAGASVLIDDPTIDYGTLVKAAAIAYFLPDHNVRVYVGPTRLGTFPKQNIHPQPCGFDYVIRALRPERDWTPVYTDPVTGLSVFKRMGSPCPGG